MIIKLNIKLNITYLSLYPGLRTDIWNKRFWNGGLYYENKFFSYFFYLQLVLVFKYFFQAALASASAELEQYCTTSQVENEELEN